MTKKRKDALLALLAVSAAISLTIIVMSRYEVLILKRGLFEGPSKYKMQLVKWFPFSEEGSLREWEEKIFKDKVIYRVEKDEPLAYVRAKSANAASALYYKIKLGAKKDGPLISWKWRVAKFPEKKLAENLGTENEDDFAARVYVIFPAMFFTNSKVLEYIWAEDLPVGTIGPSPYSGNIKLIVARSGLVKDGGWAYEERDIAEDYVKAFGRRPEYDIGAVAFMTNTEHTGTSADAMYDEIKLGYKPNSPKREGL